ncbi:MAG: hypothetical protein AAF745_11095 [Planctomycetota bacterium]
MRAISARTGALVWKESRQMMPLLWLLLGLGVFFWCLLQIGPDPNIQLWSSWLAIGLPAIFASGIGPMLVSQEKESRTIKWSTGLPVEPSQVFQTKLLVAIAGWLVLWIFALVITNVGGALTPIGLITMPSTENFHPVFWVIHGLYLLLVSFALSWRLQTGFAAMLWMLPLAYLPALLASITIECAESIGWRSQSPTVWNQLTFGFTLPCLGVAFWLAWKMCDSYLMPASPPRVTRKPSNTNTPGKLDASSIWRPPTVIPETVRPFGPTSALLWQSVCDQPRAIIALGLVTVIGLGSFPWMSQEARAAWIGVLGLAGSSLLGVSAYTGAGASLSMRFLADRGISPTRVWITRHGSRISILCTGLILLALTLTSGYRSPNIENLPLPSLWTMTLMTMTMYWVSQWISHLVRIPAATAFLSLVVGSLAIVYLGTSVIAMALPVGLIVICILFPVIATWLTMHWHMKHDRPMLFWIIHFVAFVLFLAVPPAWATFSIRDVPQLSIQRREELTSMAKSLAPAPTTLMPIAPAARPFDHWSSNSSASTSIADHIASIELLSDAPESWVSLAGDSDLPLKADSSLIYQSIGSAYQCLMSYQFMRAPAVTDASTVTTKPQSSEQRLLAWIDTLTTMASRLRKSPRWIDQDAATEIELHLHRITTRQSVDSLQDRSEIISATQLLNDSEGRNAARRQAVLRSWVDYQRQIDRDQLPNHFGGYFNLTDWLPERASVPKAWAINDAIETMVDITIEMIDAAENGDSLTPFRKAMARLTHGRFADFETSAYAETLDPNGFSDDLRPFFFSSGYPAANWFRSWEFEQ